LRICISASGVLTKKSPETSVGQITPQVEDNCMRQIPLGTKGTFTLHVQPEHPANRFKDAILPQVLATPVMILIMENAALNAMRPFLDAESAVGTAVDVRHFASTPVGRDVCATAEVVNVNLLLASESLTAFSLSPEIKVI
jgi:predicted thioesterase